MASQAQEQVIVHRRVVTAKDALSPRERRLVDSAVESWRTLLHAGGDRVQKLAGGKSLYTYRLSPGLRLVFRPSAGGVEVLDVVQPETLRQFAGTEKRTDGTEAARGPENEARKSRRR